MNISIKLLSSSDRKSHSVTFNSDEALSDEQLLEVLSSWVLNLGGSSVTSEQTDPSKE